MFVKHRYLFPLTEFSVCVFSSQEVQLREGSGEASGEAGEETIAAAGAEREKSAGDKTHWCTISV